MNDYSPKFPRSVSGREYRKPFDHPDIEKLGKQADRLYRNAPLSDDERAQLLKIHADLAIADRQMTADNKILPLISGDSTAFRAWRPGHNTGCTLGDMIAHNTGFVSRSAAWLRRVERKRVGSGIEDEVFSAETGAPAVSDDRDPGEDI